MPNLTKKELDDLKAAGYVEGRPETIPENISSVLKSVLLDGWEVTDPLDHDGDGRKGGHIDNRGKRVKK